MHAIPVLAHREKFPKRKNEKRTLCLKQEVTVELAGGKRLIFETGRMAKQASGAALVTTGENVVLATAVASPDQREGIDFFPLTVDTASTPTPVDAFPAASSSVKAGQREEILTSRQIDRPIRPLFPEASGTRRRSSRWFSPPTRK